MRKRIERRLAAGAAVVAAFVAAACTDDGPMGTIGAQLSEASYPAPAGLVTAAGFTFLPYTLGNYEADPLDPVNLIFTGNVNPLQIRAALLALDGSRSGPLSPFTCTWNDAFSGDPLVAYAAGQWTGSVIQLECGDYSPMRFHLRLYPAGEVTLGNAEFEVHIPGTADHQVLNWEIAEQLVAYDLSRTGIAVPTGVAAGINAQPYFLLIIEDVYDGLPPELQALTWPVSENVHGRPTDGNATVVNVFGEATLIPVSRERIMVFQYGTPMPKPFCLTPDMPYVYVTGPVTMTQTDVLTASGEYTQDWKAEANLSITPIDLSTGQPDFSRTYKGIIRQHAQAAFWDGMASLSYQIKRGEVPPAGAEYGRFTSFLQFGPNGRTSYTESENCSP
ncbi:MAG TPA: hypothetical protein VFH97_09735 [Gemmatimonadales bacterium]|nr:hypothetical protein [Gemmatimonadales bacterium]